MMPTTKQSSKHAFKKHDHRVMHKKTEGGGDSYGQKMITGHKSSGHSTKMAMKHDKSSMRKHHTSVASC